MCLVPCAQWWGPPWQEEGTKAHYRHFLVDSDYVGTLTARSGGFHWGKDRFLWSFPREAREASSSWYSWTPTTWPAETDIQTCSSMLPVHWRRNLVWLQISYWYPDELLEKYQGFFTRLRAAGLAARRSHQWWVLCIPLLFLFLTQLKQLDSLLSFGKEVISEVPTQ